ncbi:lipopolysaccharide biosynthesis protein [Pseudomonas sp. B21-047]|uniref:lipopolysaccharide biosynthesis protein n=1 Tax=Pseudomonas sp. B21-047 TaxID=2895489 RepID=UPI00215FB126|nr:lipopolysaccharide biosynthesis protein [Pseudomonas sp. B21-047]UVL01552.1 lipopolysaccharide biosynthesis protein [Pseudomonas sp. B21-047]
MNTLPSQPSAERGAFSSFEACRNTQQGPVVILASGASAKHFPLGEFAHLPIIAMNGSVAMTAEHGVKPFFYVCTDKSFGQQQPALFATALRDSQRLALWPEQFEGADIPAASECYALHKAHTPGLLDGMRGHGDSCVCNRALWSKRARSIAFSKNLSQGFFDARTVAYVALQLAYHLGFEEVLLVGVDLDQAVGRFYETTEGEHSPCGLDQHWDSRILPSLTLMARQVVNEHFHVYNLSAASRIPTELIPKVNLSEARRIAGCAIG